MSHSADEKLDDKIFGRLEFGQRIWAVSSIHGHAQRLRDLHNLIEPRFSPGDRLVYLGNYMGVGPDIIGTIDELLKMRRHLLSLAPGSFEKEDFVYLRGAQEEMWAKLLQLQFAPNPLDVLEWLLNHGVAATIEAYGSNLNAARGHARDGVMAITKWTSALRAAVHRHPGHFAIFSSLRRAAYTDNGKLLFVHAAIDPERPLSMQGDSFWWDNGAFDTLDKPYGDFTRVIRGYDHQHRGPVTDHPYTATLDDGCGFEGPLCAACFSTDGDIIELIKA